MVDRPDVPPEAALIKERRENRLPAMSFREAATTASNAGVKMGEAAWRSIESGRYEGKADKIAIMSAVVGVTPEELDELGRQGRENAGKAAGLLRNYLRTRAENEPALSEVDAGATSEALLQVLLEGIDDIRRAPGLTNTQKRTLEQALIRAAIQNVEGQLVQIRTTLGIAQEKARQG